MVSAPSGAAVLAVNFILITLAAAIIGARIYLRLAIQKQKLAAADWLRVAAWISAFVSAAFDIIYMKEDVLRPEINYTLANWDVPPEKLSRVLRVSITIVNRNNMKLMALQYMWASVIPFFVTFYLCKASLLVVYLQLFPPFMTKRRIVLWSVVGYCACALIVSLCLQLFLCFPIRRNWSILGPEPFCDDFALVTTFQVAWTLHFVGSLLLFALPWLVLYKLNMRKRVKIGVYCVFLLGIIDIAFSLTRFLTIQLTVIGDFRSITTIELWSGLDVYIGLIIACLPALRPYLRRKGSKYDYNYNTSGRPNNSSGPPVRRAAQSGFEEIDETPSLEGDPSPSPWTGSHSPELTAGWSDKKSNRSDIELVSLDVTAKDRTIV
ncbi:integral membrane protein [Fusarium coicis]|nr:integral membrane protein [Fusarium coicis]